MEQRLIADAWQFVLSCEATIYQKDICRGLTRRFCSPVCRAGILKNAHDDRQMFFKSIGCEALDCGRYFRSETYLSVKAVLINNLNRHYRRTLKLSA